MAITAAVDMPTTELIHYPHSPVLLDGLRDGRTGGGVGISAEIRIERKNWDEHYVERPKKGRKMGE